MFRRSVLPLVRNARSVGSQMGELGAGVGKGGGAGGSIRESGGAFGKMEAAREEEYFRKLQNDMIEKMKDRRLSKDISQREDVMKQRLEETAKKTTQE